MFNLAICYKYETEMINEREAAKYYKMAADNGHVEGMYSIANYYKDGGALVGDSAPSESGKIDD
jgi:TPR repeat protein